MSNESNKLWKCCVCGYIHTGDKPPEFCPVCGVPQENFTPYEEEPIKKPALIVDRWSCLNCSYIHIGSTPPEYCPVCNAPSHRFEPIQPKQTQDIVIDKIKKVAIVGAGIAGLSALYSLNKLSPDTEITLISKEAELPYYRLNLTRFLAGEITENELYIHPSEWYEKKKINLLKGVEVSQINLSENKVKFRTGGEESYEKLILTVGSHPFTPPIPGIKKGGVLTLRTVSDAKLILEIAKSGMKCVCIGGGLLGLETAGALAKKGLDVTLLEGFPWLLPRQVTNNGGQILQKYVESQKIKLILGAKIKEIVGDEHVHGIIYNDNSFIDADIIIISAGIRTNSYLARLAKLEVNQGIVVNNHLFTSNPNVLAAGDVAEHNGIIYGTWGPSQFQGNIAGMNALGLNVEFNGIPMVNTLKVLGIDLFSIGKFTADDASYSVVEDEKDGNYYLFVFRDSNMVGANMIGNTKLSLKVKRAIENKQDFSGLLKKSPNVQDILNFVDV